jgi:hypothetical protein
MNFLKKTVYIFIFLTSCFSFAQTVRVIDNKGTIKDVDNSKWSPSGNDIYNKNSGNIGIGTTTNPDASAKLEVKSTTSGFLPPRLTTAQRDAIVFPATGLVVFNLTTNKLEINSGSTLAPVWTSSFTPDATTTSKGILQLAGDLAGVGSSATNPVISNSAISTGKIADAAVTNSKIGEIISVEKGGTGSNMTTTVGYVKQATTGANLSTVSTIPVADVTGAQTTANLASNITANTGSTTLYPSVAAVEAYVTTSATPDASTTVKGKVKLAGDLGGTADLPTVPGLATKEPTIAAGTTTQYWRGDKSWQTLDKSTVGLNNVDNTSDANKPISTATQTALNNKEDLANKSTNTALGTSNALYPTQNAVKTYVDAQITSNSTPDASTTVKGKVKLAGDLGGTADLPTVPELAFKAPLNSPSLTGTPLAPTAASGTNTTQIATTAFVTNATSGKQDAITLTTTGTGAATLTGATLNIPTPNNGTVTNVAALTIGTTGTDISSTVATATTTPVITLNVPTASAANRGALSAADWTTFNDKIGGSGTINYLSKFSANKTLTNSLVFDDGTNVGIGTTTPTGQFEVATSNGLSAVIRRFGNLVQTPANLVFQKTYGTSGTTHGAGISTGDFVGRILFSASNGSSYLANGTDIVGYAAGLQSPTNNGGGIFFRTVPQNSIDQSIERMRINENGNVGIGTTAPITKFIVNDNAYIASLPASSSDLMNNSTFRPLTRFQTTFGVNNNAISHYLTTTAAATQAHNYSTGSVLPYILQPAGGNVGIGTTSPANKLEITQGTAGNSGLRFTNLNAASAATTSASKVLALNSTGDVILTNVPGTQTIISFSTADPNSGSPTFTPATPNDQTVIYQSATNNSMWTYSGSTYVTYSPPTSTAWNLANTTNDAGGTKTSSIWRTGNVGIGNNNPSNNLDVIGGTSIRAAAGAQGTGYGVEINTSSNAPRIDWVFNGGYIGQFSSDANNFVLQNSKLSSGGFRFTTNPGSGTLDRLNILNNGNIGIGTASPANKLEITQGTAGNSGLRFTNLNAASAATTSASKVLALNSTGDVILTNIPGTQTIISFSTADPNSGSPTFTPATPTDPTVIYQSATNNSMWTYNGSTYVTYSPPASTAWFTSGTTNDAGNSKTSNIYRTGNVGIGISTPGAPLDVQSATNNTFVTTARFLAPNNTTAGNSTLLNFGVAAGTPNSADWRYVYQGASNTLNRVDFGMSGINAPMISYLNNGNVGIGTTSPVSKLDVTDGSSNNNTIVNAKGSINDFLQYNIQNTSTGTQAQSGYAATANNGSATTGFAWMGINNSAFDFPTAYNIGKGNDVSFVGSGQDLYLANANNTKSIIFSTGTAATPFFNERMRILNNGNVGIGTATPTTTLEVANINTTAFQSTINVSSNPSALTTTGFNSTNPDITKASSGIQFLGWNGRKEGGIFRQSGALNKSHLLFTVNNTNDVAMTINENRNVGIGTTTPGSTLEVNGAATNTTAFNAAAGTSIDFSKSNLAYTTASAGAFTLTNLKDGGTYTLAVQGAASGTASFSGGSFTYRLVNNATTIAGKHTLYTFLVMGSFVYVYMTTGF